MLAEHFVVRLGVAAWRADHHAERVFALHSRCDELVENQALVLGGFVGNPKRRIKTVKARCLRAQRRHFAVCIVTVNRIVQHLDVEFVEPLRHHASGFNQDLRLLNLVRKHVHALACTVGKVKQAEPCKQRGLAVAAGNLHEAKREATPSVFAPANQVCDGELLPRVQIERLAAVLADKRKPVVEGYAVLRCLPIHF